MSDNDVFDMEIVISKCLRFGVFTSAFLISAGFIMFLITGNSGYENNIYPTGFLAILQGALVFKSYAIILLGLFMLVLTPVFRVAVSILMFAREKDYLYVKITSFVLVVIIVSFILGKTE